MWDYILWYLPATYELMTQMEYVNFPAIETGTDRIDFGMVWKHIMFGV